MSIEEDWWQPRRLDLTGDCHASCRCTSHTQETLSQSRGIIRQLNIDDRKVSLLPPQPGIRQEAFGCCSQGLVFPRDMVPCVVESLRDRGSGQVDLILKDIAKDEGLALYAQYPVMIQYLGKLAVIDLSSLILAVSTGSNSVRGTKPYEARAIWSMAFATLSARELE
ncbi:hypothetical protein E4T38_05870 [Aureobasidium subglaciale]|nr:hypothetical protein E4T38_05870 [Aureobasidium subglaciale]KAI5220820.1 hypothetical protein E4T40_05801 [Aureobasidium subglaciale]KAI5260931.1 hypothetical protein E4T46_05624 [Aureobasidium subglaciale]